MKAAAGAAGAPPPPPRKPKRRAASSSTRSAPTTVLPSPKTSAFRASSASHCHRDAKRANNQFPAPRSCSRTSPCCARAARAPGRVVGPEPKDQNPAVQGAVVRKPGPGRLRAREERRVVGLAGHRARVLRSGGRKEVRRLPRHLLVEQRGRRGAGASTGRAARGAARRGRRPAASPPPPPPPRLAKARWPKLDGGGDAYAPKGLWRESGGFEPDRSRAPRRAPATRRGWGPTTWLLWPGVPCARAALARFRGARGGRIALRSALGFSGAR